MSVPLRLALAAATLSLAVSCAVYVSDVRNRYTGAPQLIPEAASLAFLRDRELPSSARGRLAVLYQEMSSSNQELDGMEMQHRLRVAIAQYGDAVDVMEASGRRSPPLRDAIWDAIASGCAPADIRAVLDLARGDSEALFAVAEMTTLVANRVINSEGAMVRVAARLASEATPAAPR